MKKILSGICIFFTFPVLGQIITVKDKETGNALEMVTISSNHPRVFVTTNAEGRADISAFKEANRIEIRLLGYKTEVKSYASLEQVNFSVQLIHTPYSLDNVVISATRWTQLKAEVPSHISSITSKDVALQNPQTAADLLEISGEVFIQKSQQGGGSPMIRGFATNRLLYTVDGVRMNTAIFRAGNIQNVISLDAYAIENAEVFFGPGSIIYGSDAIGGVMSFQTLNPRFSQTDTMVVNGKFGARYSSANNEQTVHVDFSLGWKKWATVSSVTFSDFGDLRMGDKGPDEYLRPFYVRRIDDQDVIVDNPNPRVQVPSAYSQMNFMQKFRYQPGRSWDLQYGFHYSATSDYGRYDRHIRYNNAGLPRSAEWDYGPQIWMMNHLNITHHLDNGLYDHLIIRLAYQHFEESRIDRNMNSAIRRNRLEKVNAYSANFDFIKSIAPGKVFYYGAETVFNDVISTGTDENIITDLVSTGPSRYPMSTWASYALYVNYQSKITDKLISQTGLRFNAFSIDADFTNNLPFYPLPFSNAQINNTSLTGSIGLVYNASPKLALSTNFSTGFRAPNIDDMGKVFDSELGSVVIPNPDLKSEYAYNIEAGLAKLVGSTAKLELIGYYTILSNALVRRNFTLNGEDSIVYDGLLSRVQAVQNAASATVYGFQIGLEIKLPGDFELLNRFNYQLGEEEMDDGSISRSRHAAPWFGISRLNYNPGKWNLQFYIHYSGAISFDNLNIEERGKPEIYARDENGHPYSPSWHTLNFKAMYPVAARFSLSAGVENITDQRYRPYSSGIVSPGRNFVMALRAYL